MAPLTRPPVADVTQRTLNRITQTSPFSRILQYPRISHGVLEKLKARLLFSRWTFYRKAVIFRRGPLPECEFLIHQNNLPRQTKPVHTPTHHNGLLSCVWSLKPESRFPGVGWNSPRPVHCCSHRCVATHPTKLRHQ